MRAWPHLFDSHAWDAVYAGTRAINDGDRDIRMQLVNSLQHWPLCTTTWSSHILKSSFPTVAIQGEKIVSNAHDRKRWWQNVIVGSKTWMRAEKVMNKLLSCQFLRQVALIKRERQTWGFARSGGKCILTQCCHWTGRRTSSWSQVSGSAPEWDLQGTTHLNVKSKHVAIKRGDVFITFYMISNNGEGWGHQDPRSSFLLQVEIKKTWKSNWNDHHITYFNKQFN